MKAVLTTPSGPILLGMTTFRIGSDPANELVLNDALVSPVHAEITFAGDGHQLTDVGSSRGVMVNGQYLFPHLPQKLQDGDVIVIGKSNVSYQVDVTEGSGADSTLIKETLDLDSIGEIADYPTDVTLPAQPKSVPGANSPRSSALALRDVQPLLAETTPVLEPAAALPTSNASTFAPATEARMMQPAPQAYAISSGANYPSTPLLPPAGATSGPLVQPGYPAAYMQGASFYAPGQLSGVPGKTPKAQKREKALLWIVAAVVMLLLLGASNVGTYAFARATAPKPPVAHAPTLPLPQKALQTFCQGVMTGNAEEIYDLLSDEAKVHTSLDDIQKIFDDLKLLNGTGSDSGSINAQYSNCGFDDIRTSNSLAVATVLLSVTLTINIDIQGQKQSQTTTETVPSLTSLVWEHNQWKIDVSSITQQQLQMT